jgi:hypothetical protein
LTAQQVLFQILIGLFLIVVGAVLQPLFQRLWAWMHRPGPLSPRDKGKLVERIAMLQSQLEQTNHYIAHPKDVFVALFQLVMTTFICVTAAFGIYVFQPRFMGIFLYPNMFLLIAFAVMLSVVGIFSVQNLSDKNIDAHKASIQKQIDEATRKLNTPVQD